MLMILGGRSSELLKMDENNLSFTNLLVLVIPAALGFAICFVIMKIFENMGYQ